MNPSHFLGQDTNTTPEVPTHFLSVGQDTNTPTVIPTHFLSLGHDENTTAVEGGEDNLDLTGEPQNDYQVYFFFRLNKFLLPVEELRLLFLRVYRQ